MPYHNTHSPATHQATPLPATTSRHPTCICSSASCARATAVHAPRLLAHASISSCAAVYLWCRSSWCTCGRRHGTGAIAHATAPALKLVHGMTGAGAGGSVAHAGICTCTSSGGAAKAGALAGKG